jgi:hypothetical protein
LGAVIAQDTTQPADTPPKVRELLDLLADPAVRDWLNQQQATQIIPTPVAASLEIAPSAYLAKRLAAIRQHLHGLAVALATVPADFERAGIGAEWLYYWAAAGLEKWIIELPLDTAGQRLRAVAIRLGYGIAMVTAFTIGSIGAFLVFDWPPLLREIVLGYLLAFLILRVTLIFGRFLLAPGGERFRIIPMSTPAAWYWFRRFGFFVGWFDHHHGPHCGPAEYFSRASCSYC